MKEEDEGTPRDDDFPTDAMARFLLIVGDPQMHHSLSEFLTLEGYAADTAADVFQAIAMVATKRYRLVLMEVTDVPILMQAICKQDPEMVVVVMTGYDMIDKAEEAVKGGAFEYVVRPIVDDEIRATIHRALRRWGPRTENYQMRQQPRLQAGLDGGYRWWRRLQSSLLRKPPGRR